MPSISHTLSVIAQGLRPLSRQHTFWVAALIGATAALVTLGFREGILALEGFLFGRSDSLVNIATSLAAWQRVLSPAAGGVVAGLLLQWANRQMSGHRGGDYMEAIALGSGDLPVRASIGRALSSAVTVATGGAIGREGPMVQLAALAGSLWGRWRDLPVPRRRLYVACGAAAGVATAYNAPIAGALFIAEVVLHSLAMGSLAPLIVSAVAANLVMRALAGDAPLYHVSPIVLDPGPAIAILAVLGLLAGVAAPAYLWGLDRARAAFARVSAPLWAKLGVGGMLVGLISVVNPGVWGNGDSVVNDILQGHWLWPALLTILVLKLLAVAATTGSGAVGGIFTPTLFVGAVLGGLFGSALQGVWPHGLPVTAAVVVGMGAFLAACSHAPLMSILIIFEMTQNYALIVPLMAACVLGYAVSRALRARSIYAVAEGNARPAPVLTLAEDLLHPSPPTIVLGQSLRQLEQVFSQWRWQHTYVVDGEGLFVGAISLHDFRHAIRGPGDLAAPVPPDLVRTDYPTVSASSPIWQVMDVFMQHPGERLPVLDPDRKLVGFVVKSDLIRLCREYLAAA